MRTRRKHVLAGFSFLVLLAASTFASATSTVEGVRVPRSYRVARLQHLGTGVAHLQLVRSGPDQVLHIARLAKGSPYKLRMLLSNGYVSGPQPRTEKTTSMCRRVNCLLATNGDFYTTAGTPVGGVVLEGEPVRSPIATRSQFILGSDAAMSIGALQMSTALVSYYPQITQRLLRTVRSTESRTTTVDGVNVAPATNKLTLYTPRFGPTTETRGGTELIARVVSPSGPLLAGVDTAVDLVAAGAGNSRIPSDGAVLSGNGDGASALQKLWDDVQQGRANRRATLRVSVSPGATQSVAGNPMLVRDGDRVTSTGGARAPRTMIGWNSAGDVLLVTVDGRQSNYALGVTLAEAAELMRALGAVYALNLDGGGSTTFVVKGALANRPSDRRERAVAVGVAIVVPR